MNDIRLSSWSKLKYKDPKDWLIKLSKIERKIASLVAEERVRALRTNELRWAREARQAGIFTYGMSIYQRKNMGFALAENETCYYDFIVRFFDNNTEMFVPVQLKEWVPEKNNPKQSLNEIYEKLRKYSKQDDLTIAICINRQVYIDMTTVRLKETKFADVWIFGSCSPDKSRWFLCGDMQKSPSYFEFDYPNG